MTQIKSASDAALEQESKEMNRTLQVIQPGVIDPVCGMTVDPNSAAASYEYKGKTYYFCATHCKHRFEKDPESFLNPTAAPPPAVKARKYTCPMHPEIVRDGPGSCPICGMALEPLTASLDEEDNTELTDMTRRLWIAAILALPVLAIGMSELIPGQPLQHRFSMKSLAWLQLVLASPVVLGAGWPFFVRAWQSLVNRSLNMFTLIGLGVAVGYLFSVIAV